MNVGSSVPFYPGKNKAIPKPAMHQINSYKEINKRIPTSASHGILAGMGGNESHQKMYGGPPPGLENSIPSQTNLYSRPHMEEISDNRNWPKPYHNTQEANYMQWQGNASQMIPSALQGHRQEGMPMKKKAANMKGSMSTEFNYNFGGKLLNDNDEKYDYGFLDNNSDSDENTQRMSQPFPSHVEPIRKFTGTSLRNLNDHEEAKENKSSEGRF